MQLTIHLKPFRVKRWLPYWAVFQMDVRQTCRSWIFRVWLLTSVCVSVGYLMHRTAIHHQAGIIQSASSFMEEILKFSLLIGTTLVVLLTAGTISSERGIVADSVLSRGISRYQYFMGKWHSRMVTILGSFLLTGATVLIGSSFLLKNDVSIFGSLLALVLVAALLGIVVSAGVAMSSMSTSTVLSIVILWIAIYGSGIALALLNATPLNPMRLLDAVPTLLSGEYSLNVQARTIVWSLLASLCVSVVGILYFARRDV